jgi:hypothetical protein
MRRAGAAIACILALMGVSAEAGEVVVQLPAGVKATSASAAAADKSGDRVGSVEEGRVLFANLPEKSAFDLAIATTGGRVFQGFDPRWYDGKSAAGAADSGAGAFTDDDRLQIQGILNEPSFYNSSTIQWLGGDHRRAVVLVRLLRDQAFYHDKGDEVIWRMELQYFENENGGWARVPNVSRVLRRQRFASHAEYHHATDRIVWTPTLGGIWVTGEQTMTLPLVPTTAPSTTQPASVEPEY